MKGTLRPLSELPRLRTDARSRFSAPRQDDRDVRAALLAVSQLHPAAVSPGDQIDDRQPEAGPAGGARTVGTAETIERARREVLG